MASFQRSLSRAASEILAPLPLPNVLPEHPVNQEEQQLPLPRQSSALGQRRARRERIELEVSAAPRSPRQLGDPSQRRWRVRRELRAVLVGDLGVRTEIDHHQLSAPPSPQEFFDHAARDNGLAEPDFVGEKKAARAASVRQTLADRLNRGALKLGKLEARHGRLPLRVTSRNTAQNSRNVLMLDASPHAARTASTS